jgi:hypothetical protein
VTESAARKASSQANTRSRCDGTPTTANSPAEASRNRVGTSQVRRWLTLSVGALVCEDSIEEI